MKVGSTHFFSKKYINYWTLRFWKKLTFWAHNNSWMILNKSHIFFLTSDYLSLSISNKKLDIVCYVMTCGWPKIKKPRRTQKLFSVILTNLFAIWKHVIWKNYFGMSFSMILNSFLNSCEMWAMSWNCILIKKSLVIIFISLLLRES